MTGSYLISANLLPLLTLLLLTPHTIPPTSAGFGHTPSHSSQNPTPSELTRNSNVASWSADSAVAAAVGRDYASQLSTTAQYTAAFTAPVTKSQAAAAFNAVRYQQQGSLVSAALANAAPAIAHAGNSAARSNFDQAYAGAEGDRLAGVERDEGVRRGVWQGANDLAAATAAQSQAAHYADVAKTAQTRTNAAAIQAVHGIVAADRAASYGK